MPVCCPVRWKVIGEVMDMSGGSSRAIGWWGAVLTRCGWNRGGTCRRQWGFLRCSRVGQCSCSVSHAVHTHWSSIVLFHPSRSLPLNLVYQCLDGVGCEEIPYRIGVLQHRSYRSPCMLHLSTSCWWSWCWAWGSSGSCWLCCRHQWYGRTNGGQRWS